MQISALIVEDDKDARNLLYEFINDLFPKIYKSRTAEEALEIVKSDETIQLILLDWNLPGISGVDLSKIIRESTNNRYIYIIMITGERSNDSIVLAYEKGVDDYIVKPFQFSELKAKLKTAIRIIEMENNLKNKFKEAHLKAIYDSLTQVLNRSEIFEKLNLEFIRHSRNNDEFGIILLDIDFFKKINDTFGHQFGDFVLKQTAEIIKNNCRSYDYIGRYGGEEFLIICPNTDKQCIFNIANRVRKAIEEFTFSYQNISTKVTISAGISSSEEADSIEKLIEIADKRLYQSKADGRNRITA